MSVLAKRSKASAHARYSRLCVVATRGTRHFCPVIGLTEHIHDTARRLADRYQMTIDHAIVVAMAIDAGATLARSEDMRPGVVVERDVSVATPFRGSFATEA